MKFCLIPVMLLFSLTGSSLSAQNTKSVQATSGKLTFTVTTITNNSTYSPKNVFAMWIKDANGKFVASCKVMANARKVHLVKWNASSGGNVVNAVTGSTLPNHQTHTITWDGKNAAGALAEDGTYQIWVEYTSTNSSTNGNAGPSMTAEFTKGTTTQHQTPANTTYFQNIVVDWAPFTTTAIDQLPAEHLFKMTPNPSSGRINFRLNIEKKSLVTVNLYSLSGNREILFNEIALSGELTFSRDFSTGTANLPKGIYLVEVIANGDRQVQKLVIQ